MSAGWTPRVALGDDEGVWVRWEGDAGGVEAAGCAGAFVADVPPAGFTDNWRLEMARPLRALHVVSATA